MTYSIVARDLETGEIGVAVETALPAVGRLCPWAEAGIGAIASQALARQSHGASGLVLLRNGHNAPQALAACSRLIQMLKCARSGLSIHTATLPPIQAQTPFVLRGIRLGLAMLSKRI